MQDKNLNLSSERFLVKDEFEARILGLDSITMAVFVPVLDEAVLASLSGTETADGIEVTVVAIGWV